MIDYDGRFCELTKVYQADRDDGFLQKWDLRECIEFAAAASCFKQTIPGDINLSGVEEIKRLAMGDASGRVQR